MPSFRSPLALVLALALGAPALAQPRPSEPPPPLAERPVAFPAFEEAALPNGLPLLFVEHHGQPLVTVTLYVLGGSALDPAEQAGRAALVADLLTQGTPTRTAREIAETIEGVGGRLGASAGGDWISVSVSVLAEHAPLAFDLLADVVRRPTFPEQEFETVRRRTLSGLQAQLGQPGAIAARQFARVLYGSHPYGVSATPATVERIAREDLVAFHREAFVPENALLVIAGALPRAEAEALARTHFGDWTGGPAPRVAFPEVAPPEATRIVLVHRPGSVQSTIRVGHPATRPGDPDFFALQVLNKVLGSGTDARLFQILREERGWTYGAYSQFTRPRDLGFFLATAEVRTEVTDSAVVEIMHQLRRLRDEAIPDEEFEAAVSFLAGSFPLRIETPGQIAAQVAQARLLGLDPDDVTEYRQRILAVTPEAVRAAARRHVRPDAAVILVVGDAAQLLERLEPIAPVDLYDVEGNPLERDALVVRAAEERFDAGRLTAGTWTYAFTVQGSPFGTLRQTLAREGDAWVARSTLESALLEQESEARFGARDFAARAASQRVRQGPVTIVADLRVEEGRLVGRLEAPPQVGGARDVDAPLPEGALLPGMDAYVLAAADLAVGRTIALPVFDATSGALTTVTYRVEAEEEVTVPAGTFRAFRVSVEGAQPMTLHLRREAPHVLLRQTFAGQPVTIELQAME